MSELTVKLSRGDGTPWGFRLGGGKDFGYPLAVQRVNPGSLAEQGGLRTGDAIARINGKSSEHMRHKDAQDCIVAAGNYLEIAVQRGGSLTWAPSVTPVGEIAPGSQGPLTRTSLSAVKQAFNPVGSGHNTSAKGFGPQVVNKQYNCPASLYSMDNIKEALEKQTEVLTTGVVGINFMKDDKPLNTESAVYKLVHEEDKVPRAPISPAPRPTSGVDSAPSFLPGQAGLRHVEPSKAVPVSPQPQGNVTVGGPNVCAECGKLIVGVFCRIKDRNMHAECFRCATCGNSLKNQGYYLVGGKLYCDIHARNASVMLNEPVSPTSSQPVPMVPLPVAPPSPFGMPSSFAAPISPTPFAPSAQPPFKSVPPPVPPKPSSQRNSGCYDAAPPPMAAPPVPFYPNRFTWPPQENNTVISNAIPSAPTYRPPPGTQRVQRAPMFQPYYDPAAPKWPPQPQQNVQQNVQQSSFQQTTQNTQSSQSTFLSGLNAGAGSRPAPKRGRGLLNQAGGRIPVCSTCGTPIRGPFITALGKSWCPGHFFCANSTCRRDLMDCGFVEEQGQLYCECCYENYMAPICKKCNQRIKGDCLNAIDKQWHPQCFTCTYCRRPFGNSSFYLEDGMPYCEKDWNEMFTSKCFGCGFPIEAGDRWVEALNNNFHSTCFKCTVCHNPLEGQSFYAKAGKPYCRLHAR